jgi:hypothetical protein
VRGHQCQVPESPSAFPRVPTEAGVQKTTISTKKCQTNHLPSKSRVTHSASCQCQLSLSQPTPASRGSSISQHLRATKKILRDVISDAKYVWSAKGGGPPNAPRRRTDTQACRTAATLDSAEVQYTNEMDAWIATDAYRILGQHSRARRFRGPPPDSRLEKHVHIDQQDPS